MGDLEGRGWVKLEEETWVRLGGGWWDCASDGVVDGGMGECDLRVWFGRMGLRVNGWN